MLRSDAGVLRALAARMGSLAPRSGQSTNGWLEIVQDNIEIENFRYAFGAIDRLDFEVDFAERSVRVWFQDRYEWHPVYEGMYDRQPGDIVRETNCLHAAMVEMKLTGAADFWMKGKAVVPLSLIQAAGRDTRSRIKY
jgi:hypothetical protein